MSASDRRYGNAKPFHGCCGAPYALSHWQSALAKQGLNRWFTLHSPALHAPSDSSGRVQVSSSLDGTHWSVSGSHATQSPTQLVAVSHVICSRKGLCVWNSWQCCFCTAETCDNGRASHLVGIGIFSSHGTQPPLSCRTLHWLASVQWPAFESLVVQESPVLGAHVSVEVSQELQAPLQTAGSQVTCGRHGWQIRTSRKHLTQSHIIKEVGGNTLHVSAPGFHLQPSSTDN